MKRWPKQTVARRSPARNRLGDGDWVAAARDMLIAKGIGQVKVEVLAKTLRVTTGSFYWHFKNRHVLHEALLADWVDTNTAAMERALTLPRDPTERLKALMDMWIEEDDYSSAYDAAVRAWARTSKAVEATVRDVDARRIDLIAKVFEGFGYSSQRAFIRARITYFHQVGYYAMDIFEDKDTRYGLKPLYFEALTGIPLEPRSRHE